MNSFIHFGCWNNLNVKIKNGKEKEIGCLKKVMNLLEANLSGVDFIVIAGDNYYPKKEKTIEGVKKKLIIPNKLAEGFNLLPKEKPIVMILGNHDLETNLNPEKPKLFIEENPEESRSCSILELEKLSKGSNIEYTFFKDQMMDNGTLVIMIDSDVYSIDAYKFLPCYNIFLSENFENIDNVKEYQYNLIFQKINQYNAIGSIKNLIIIGHQPITGIKYKDGVKQPPLNDIPYFKPVLLEIYNLLGSEINYFYLCADLHLYQDGLITLKNEEEQKEMKIKQFIVGTGGTELDDAVPENINFVFSSETIDYKMISSKQECGILKCEVDGLEPKFEFISIEQKGGRKKTKKRERKKRKRSRKI
jgi:predicted MPP superfamily phosphohydrolase